MVINNSDSGVTFVVDYWTPVFESEKEKLEYKRKKKRLLREKKINRIFNEQDTR